MSEQQTQDKKPNLIWMDSIRPTVTKWLWYPYIPLGKVTILMGDPGEGKSTLACALTAAVTKGLAFPDQHQSDAAPNYVLIQNAEDGLADTLRPRLDKAGADVSMVVTINENKQSAEMMSSALFETIRELKPKLVILDPLQAYLGADVDMHRANEIRPVMHYLSRVAEIFGCAIVLIGHLNKRGDMKSIYRSIGSIDLTAAARSVLLIARDPAEPEHRVIKHIKSSLAPEGETVSFRIEEDGSFVYEGAYEIETDKLLSQRERRESPRERAAVLVRAWLTQHGDLSAQEIYRLADSEGIAKSTLMRAKQMLHIKCTQTRDGWLWHLP